MPSSTKEKQASRVSSNSVQHSKSTTWEHEYHAQSSRKNTNLYHFKYYLLALSKLQDDSIFLISSLYLCQAPFPSWIPIS